MASKRPRLDKSIPSTCNTEMSAMTEAISAAVTAKVMEKLQDKIKHKEFIDMSDILVDHHPADVDLHIAVKNKRVGVTSGKKRKFLNIENWTDAFAIFSSVLRKVNPNHLTLAEDLAIYTDLIRQIHKDGGDWYFYDVNFRQTLQNDDTLSWSYVDQILHTRALNRNITKQNNMQNKIQQAPYNSNIKPFPTAASRRTCHKYNEGRPCDGFCGYPHICRLCIKGHPMLQCNRNKTQNNVSSKAGVESTFNTARPSNMKPNSK